MNKNIRIIIWLLFVIISIIFISPKIDPQGLFVTSTNIEKIKPGDIIYKINDELVIDSINKNYQGLISFETSNGKKFINVNGSLNISTKKPPTSNLKFGLDLEGGVRALVKVDEASLIEQTISVLQTRINIYGLRESSFRPIVYQDNSFIEISMAGGNSFELKELLERQGKFEAKIPFSRKLVDNKTSFSLEKNYELEISENKIFINNEEYGNEFILEDVLFNVNFYNDTIDFIPVVYYSEDIVNVFIDPQRSRIEKTGETYRWDFTIQLSNKGAEKFAHITKNIDRNINSLTSPINLYIDEELINSLSISANLKGQVNTEILITGSANSLEEAQNEQNTFRTILKSGSLPTKIEIVSIDNLSPTLGNEFIKSSMLAGLVAIFVITFVIFIRYRNILATLSMIIVSLTEVIIILGASVLIGWTIDLAAIAGIIAAVGTGVDSQIIIMDQASRKKDETLKEKLRRALTIIVGAGGVTIAAMFPLMIFGFGLLRGFAITTMVGVLAGIFITRPAFSIIVEKLMRKSELK